MLCIPAICPKCQNSILIPLKPATSQPKWKSYFQFVPTGGIQILCTATCPSCNLTIQAGNVFVLGHQEFIKAMKDYDLAVNGAVSDGAIWINGPVVNSNIAQNGKNYSGFLAYS